MRSMFRRTVTITGALAASAGAAALFLIEDPPRQTLEAALVIDQSPSVAGGCDDMRTIGRALVAAAGHRQLTVRVFALGTNASDGQPVSLGSVELDGGGSALEGAEAREAGEAALLAGLEAACARAPATRESPIFDAVREVSKQLMAARSLGRELRLIVRSDLQEERDRSVIRLMRARKAGPPTSPKIENEGIKTLLCGTALRLPHKGSAPSPDRVAAAWRAHFRANVSIMPFCDHHSVVGFESPKKAADRSNRRASDGHAE